MGSIPAGNIFSGNEDSFIAAFFMQNCNFSHKFVSETGLKILILSAGMNACHQFTFFSLSPVGINYNVRWVLGCKIRKSSEIKHYILVCDIRLVGRVPKKPELCRKWYKPKEHKQDFLWWSANRKSETDFIWKRRIENQQKKYRRKKQGKFCVYWPRMKGNRRWNGDN